MPHALVNNRVHVIFSTKGRESLVTSPLREELYAYIGGILRGHQGALLEIGGMPDHLHLVICLVPNTSVAEIVRLVKANSSKWVNERPERVGRFAWQSGYGAFSVSLSRLATVRKYVRCQEDHHRTKTFQEEFVEFLRRHQVEFNEDHLWD